MTGLVIAIALALIAAIALKFGARVGWKDMAAPAAALFVGLAGYTWQGHWGLPGHDVKPDGAAKFDERVVEKRRSIGERMGPASTWLVMSDGLARAGDSKDAANIIARALEQSPKDPNLWVGLGNALLAHGDERLSPAADYAYRQALALEPDGISPNYFYGLALAQSGQLDAAKPVWGRLAAHLPEGSDMREELIRDLVVLNRFIAARDAERAAGKAGS